ncbi:MAG TPA: T9SS type A sorting domain-containing protein [Saprospiraceae bacterium]|nr:T9SS type A sorting domain-containing protein [Saprospiraceae bacterium]
MIQFNSKSQFQTLGGIVVFISISIAVFASVFHSKNYRFSTTKDPLTKIFSISCQNIYLSLNEFCQDTITVDAVLADKSLCCAHLRLDLSYYGAPVPNPITKDYLGKSIKATVYDSISGNSCWSTIFVEDKFSPVILCLEDTVSCQQFFSDQVIVPQVADNCTNAHLRLLDEVLTPLDCDDDYIKIVTRKWVAEDSLGNVSDTCTQTILIERFLIDSVVYPSNDTFLCSDIVLTDDNGFPSPFVTGVPLYFGDSLYPNNPHCYVNVDYLDEDLGEVSCIRKILRTWRVIEFHCNTRVERTMPQWIYILDTSGPQIINPILDFELSVGSHECYAIHTLPSIDVVDACHNIVRIDVIYPKGVLINQNGGQVKLPVGRDTIIYRAYDQCYRLTADTVIATVRDLSAPVAICEKSVIVSIPQSGQALLSATAVDDGSYDSCGDVELAVRRMDLNSCETVGEDDWGPSIRFCCADAGKEIMIALRVTDLSGNTSVCMTIVEVQDKAFPLIVCPPDIQIDCSFDFDLEHLATSFGEVVDGSTARKPIVIDPSYHPVFYGPAVDGYAEDVCLDTVIETVDSKLNNCQQGIITRTFIARDFAGNTDTCKQTIHVVQFNILSSLDVVWPLDFDTLSCDPVSLIPELLEDSLIKQPIVLDNECRLIGISYDDKFYQPSPGEEACSKIFRCWSVLDWCSMDDQGNMIILRDTQIIKLINKTPPQLVNPCRDTSFCNFQPNCPPLLVNLPYPATDDCIASDELYYQYRVDLFSNGSIDVIQDGIGKDIFSATLPVGVHLMHVTIEDRCGNYANCTHGLEIRNCKPPTAYCYSGLALSLVAIDTNGDGIKDVEVDTLYARDLNLSSDTNCGSSLSFAFSTNFNDTVRVYNCDSIGRREVNMYVRDQFGNTDFCKTFVIVQDNNMDTVCPQNFAHEIYGIIKSSKSEALQDVQIFLKGSTIEEYSSDVNGEYRMGKKQAQFNGLIEPVKSDDMLNGVSTADIVMIQKHLLGLQEFNNPFQYIAADVNLSKSVTTKDIADIRKLILGIDTKFEHAKSWRFLDASYQFQSVNNCLYENWQETYRINQLSSDLKMDFVAVKLGDLNFNAKVHFNKDQIETRSSKPLQIHFTDLQLLQDQRIEIPITIENGDQFDAFQFTLNLDPTQVELIQVVNTSSIFGEEFYSLHQKQKGKLPVAWNGNLNSNTTLFSILIQTKKPGLLSNAIKLNSEITPAVAFEKGSGDQSKIEFWARLVSESGERTPLCVEPNPWKVSASLHFYCEHSSMVDLQIFDVSGKQVYSKSRQCLEGRNEWIIKRDELAGTGVYLVQLSQNGQTYKSKMILID